MTNQHQYSVPYDKIREIIAHLTDGEEIHDLVDKYGMSENDAVLAVFVRDHWFREQRDRIKLAGEVMRRSGDVTPPVEEEDTDAVAVGTPIRRRNRVPIKR